MRPVAAWLFSMGAVWALLVPRTQAAAPTVVSDPSTNPITAPNDPAEFFFNHGLGMDRTAIDVTWQGNGIDASRITYAWLPASIPGFTLPALTLECRYQGGWPLGVVVAWTMNRNNSRVMKSANGEVLAETTGFFTTPGTPSGGGVTITPSATQLAVGQKLSFQFSAAMDTSVSASTIFQITAGQWQAAWDSPTALGCTLNGGVQSGPATAATYTLVGLKTATGTAVPNFVGTISLSAASAGNAPQVVPPTAVVQGKVSFVFDKAMDSSGIDVKWSGTGIDPPMITSAWLIISFPGQTPPVNILESTYQGGWPSNVDVTWTLNQGNSGVIKSAQGVALATVSGSFNTGNTGVGPGPGPGGCEPSNEPTAAAALSLFKEINYVQTSPADPVFDTVEKATINASVFMSPSNAPPAVAASVTLNRPVGGSVAWKS